MADLPNIGATVATMDGLGGSVWGTFKNDEGVFVQFGPGGGWHPVAEAAPPAEPAVESSPEGAAAPRASKKSSAHTELPAPPAT